MPRTLNIKQKWPVTEPDDELVIDEDGTGTLQPAAADAPEKAALDETEQSEPISDPPRAQGEDLREVIRSVSKELGWTPQEEWPRDPAQWRDEVSFLKDTPRHLKQLQERLRRQGQATDAVIEEERKRAREEALAELRTADDPDAREAAGRKLAANSGPSPQTQAWIAGRAWFHEDPAARAEAAKAVNVAFAAGLSETEQLEAADLAVKRRYPEYYPSEQRADPDPPRRETPQPKEARLSEVPRPAVQPGTRTASPSVPKERGYRDIPKGDRADFEKHMFRHLKNRLKVPGPDGRPRQATDEEVNAHYAKAYWAENKP